MQDNACRSPDNARAKSQPDLRSSLAIACLLIALDAAFTGSYLLSLLCCPVWTIHSIFTSVRERASKSIILLKVAIPALTLGVVLANNVVQVRIAEMNAERIVSACEAFRVSCGEYPTSLDELVPRYLPSVPRAKYCLAFGNFFYSSGRRPRLVWCVTPPFHRRIYDFEMRRWSYIDYE
jgi:hypothetical protein